MNISDGRSDLIGGVLGKNGMVTGVIDEEEYEANKEASDACPVNIIRLQL